MDFLKTLADKFLDFFNIGRAISIFIPGALVSIALMMWISTLAFPPEPVSAVAGADGLHDKPPTQADQATPRAKAPPSPPSPHTPDQKKPSAAGLVPNAPGTAHAETPITKNRPEGPTQATLSSSRPDAKDQSKASPVSAAPKKSSNLLRNQMINDFKRVKDNYWVIILLSLIVGILLFEIGTIRITAWGKTIASTETPMPQAGSEGAETKGVPGPDLPKLYRWSGESEEGKLELKPIKDDEVGLVYFAPFLKDPIATGKENYWEFIISEYYRFLEFSAVMPLAISTATVIGYLYFLTLCWQTSYWSVEATVLTMIALVILVLVRWFYNEVLGKIYFCYRKATVDLIRGIADAKSMGAFNPPQNQSQPPPPH